MRGVNRLIDNVHPAAAQHQVVKRKPCAVAGRLRVRRLEPRQDVVDVIPALAKIGQQEFRLLDRQRIRHRRQPQQGHEFRIYIEAPYFQLGNSLWRSRL